MSALTEPRSVLPLGTYEFDPVSLTLTRGGAVVRAQRKTLELLSLLVEDPGATVASARLRERLWPQGYVEDRNLTQHVYLLRGVLADDPNVRVETLARRGYRLIAPHGVAVALALPAKSARRGSFAHALARAAAFAFCSLGLAATAGFASHQPTRALSPQVARVLQLGWMQWELREKLNLSAAERYFTRVVEAVPDDARGYAGLAAVAAIRGDYADRGKSKPFYAAAARFARQALDRDPRNADAYDVLGLIAFDRSQDVVEADALFKRAQSLDPNNAYAHIWRGIALMHAGRLEEATGEFGTGELLDPGSKTAARWLGFAKYDAHAFDAAAEQFRTVLELDPRDMETVLYLAYVDEARGDYGAAIARLKAAEGIVTKPIRLAALARLDALTGDRVSARRNLDAATHQRSGMEHLEGPDLASVQLALGDRAGALATLARIAKGSAWDRAEAALALRWDVRFAALRQVARTSNIASINNLN
jgi:DNA-binding winged helix-turn-helix (wHTH) protein/Tfp pilus assembly protein PilF